jgi:hypothetical protein
MDTNKKKASRRGRTLVLLALVAAAGGGGIHLARRARRPSAPTSAADVDATVAAGRARLPGGARRGSIPALTSRRLSPRRQIVLEAAWGAAPGAMGRVQADQAASEGPLSFAVDEAGRIHVLDQANGRIQIFADGKLVDVRALPPGSWEDLQVDAAGRHVLLDRQEGGRLAFVGADGKAGATIPLVGAGIEDAASVSGLQARPDGIWVEVGGEQQVRVADRAGQPDPRRPVVEGRLSADGKAVTEVAAGPQGVTVSSRAVEAPPGSAQPLAELGFSLPVDTVESLGADAAGRSYLVAHQVDDRGPTPLEARTLVVLDRQGVELGRVDLPVGDGALDQFQSVRVAPDGSLYRFTLADRGAVMERISL